MSALDQAFIRAYAKDGVPESTRTPAAGSASKTSAAPASSVAFPSTITIAAFSGSSSAAHGQVASGPGMSGDRRRETAPIVLLRNATVVTSDAPAATVNRPLGAIPAPHINLERGSSAAAESSPLYPTQSYIAASFSAEAVASPVVNPTRIDARPHPSAPAPHFLRGRSAHPPATAAPPAAIAPPVDAVPQAAMAPPIVLDSPTDVATVSSELNELPASRQALLEASRIAKPKFSAVWEVDRFEWPETCQRMLSAAFDYFRDAGVELRNAAREGLQSLAITSARRGEGRTTTALCLAHAVAAAGARVAIVDADMDNPQLAERLNIQLACGWDDVVRGELPPREAAVQSLAERITLFPLTDVVEKRDFSLSDARVTDFLRSLVGHFDLVVLDMGPIGDSDRRLFAGGDDCPIDSAFVVRDLRLTGSEDASTAVSRLKANGVRSVGIVENFV